MFAVEPGDQIVDGDHLGTIGQQSISQVRPEKTRPPVTRETGLRTKHLRRVLSQTRY